MKHPQDKSVDGADGLMRRVLRICVVGEWLHGRPDEGIHNLAQHLSHEWRKDHPVWTIRIGPDFAVNRLFLSVKLCKLLRSIRPDLVFYISPSSAKTTALVRAKMLKAYSPQARVLVIACQPAAYRASERHLLPLFAPDGIFVQSPRGEEALGKVGCPVHFLPSGVDLARFAPVEPGRKVALRRQYGVDEDGLVLLHVGHIRRSRNVELLSLVSRLPNTQAILVASSTVSQDELLACELARRNVRIIRHFVPHVEDLYHLADVYLFPVVSEHAAIGVPLSVLEAMACNLPVITTRFGGLPMMFHEGQGLFYFDNESQLPELVRKASRLSACSTRVMAGAYTWSSVATDVLAMAQGEGHPL
jgi:glycosyltransferase involved in cell wall biosynthesis